MIALAVIGKEKDVTEYGHSALKEAKDVLRNMLDERTKTSQFKPMRVKESVEQPFKEMTIEEFERQELAKSTIRGAKTKGKNA